MSLPTVTQVLRATLGPGWQATEWHLQRGRAIHAACALLAKGIPFESDPRIAGQIEACRKFLDTYKPDIIEIEQRRSSKLYSYTGQPDLYVWMRPGTMGAVRAVIDYKASLAKDLDDLQLGGYAELMDCRHGLAVELHEDGTFKATELLNLMRARREFLACRTVYNILERLGRLPKEEEEHG